MASEKHSLELTGGHINTTPSVTLPGLASIIKNMRWHDLHTFATELETMRCQRSAKSVDAVLIHEWANT